MNWLRWRHRVEYLAFRIIVCLIDALPTRTIVRLSTILAFVFCRILPRKLTRYEIAKQHIRQAFGENTTDAEIDRIIFGMWTHLFRMVTEIVQLPRKLRLYNCADVIEYRNRDRLVQALCSGRPVSIWCNKAPSRYTSVERVNGPLRSNISGAAKQGVPAKLRVLHTPR